MSSFDLEDERIAKAEAIIQANYIKELEELVEWLKVWINKNGEHPQDGDTDEVAWLRGMLSEARTQRDATQKALDKANRDNDGLRAELRGLEKLRADLAALSEAIGREQPRMLEDRAHSVWYVGGNEVGAVRYLNEDLLKALVDGGAGYFVEDEEE